MTARRYAGTGWKSLYYAGGVAALIAVLVFRRNLAAELALAKGFGVFDVPAEVPGSALEWFAVFQQDPLAGLLLFNFGDLINCLLVGLIFLALYGALRRISQGAMLAAGAFSFVGIAVNLASNQALAMLSLSNRFAEAATVGQRAAILAAAEALLAIDNPGAVFKGSGYYLSLFLVLAAGLVISIVMLRSADFARATGCLGIVANGVALLYFLAVVLAPSLIWLPPTAAALFRIAWYILIAVGLFRLGRRGNSAGKDQSELGTN